MINYLDIEFKQEVNKKLPNSFGASSDQCCCSIKGPSVASIVSTLNHDAATSSLASQSRVADSV